MFKKRCKKMNIVSKSKYNNKCKKEVNLLMIGDGKKYHYLAITVYLDCFKETHQIIEEIFIV